MEIGVTIPLQKILGWKQPPYGDDPRPFLCWDAHRAEVMGRKLLFVVNSANRFAGVRSMSGADWKRLDAVVCDVIDQAMETEGIPSWMRQRYFDVAGAPVFTKTHGRRPVAFLNRVVDDVWFCSRDGIAEGATFQTGLTAAANGLLTHCATRRDYVVPREAFAQDLDMLISKGTFQ